LNLLLDHQTTLDDLIALDPAMPALSDDRPINEYFMIRTPFREVMDMQSLEQ